MEDVDWKGVSTNVMRRGFHFVTQIAVQLGCKTEKAKQVGQAIAKKALAAGIESISFDRGGYLYHGRVKSLAEGAREGGLKF